MSGFFDSNRNNQAMDSGMASSTNNQQEVSAAGPDTTELGFSNATFTAGLGLIACSLPNPEPNNWDNTGDWRSDGTGTF